MLALWFALPAAVFGAIGAVQCAKKASGRKAKTPGPSAMTVAVKAGKTKEPVLKTAVESPSPGLKQEPPNGPSPGPPKESAATNPTQQAAPSAPTTTKGTEQPPTQPTAPTAAKDEKPKVEKTVMLTLRGTKEQQSAEDVDEEPHNEKPTTKKTQSEHN
ncbi:hypothetical protein M3Y99_01057300 [Aphelenchoides fujianensis]|nr:hypothetical protein M3Y99_01057300 [Aphelenchoides fujianensis]